MCSLSVQSDIHVRSTEASARGGVLVRGEGSDQVPFHLDKLVLKIHRDNEDITAHQPRAVSALRSILLFPT